jgi:hypothetical protein
MSASGAVPFDSTLDYRRFTMPEYEQRVVSPRALLHDIVAAGIGQVTNSPKEWSRTWHGYGDRLSARLAKGAISQAVTLGVSAMLDERPAHFTLCQCVGTGPRLLHAVLTPWEMSSPGGTHFSIVAPASEIATSILVTGVQPRGMSVTSGLSAAGLSLLVGSLGSAAREFWPWHKRPFGL